ncbi:phasin family protein [Plantactinospora sp. GCM10030261]|uniref:phasin family protein n=1 Tax=Plantactinospora sp. GCM10030261 TaxID=3273420 RepID=UPI0036105B5E
MQDAWRAYLDVALGLTEASRKKAQTAVRRMVGQSGATAAQLQSLAEELVSTGLANREALTKLVRFEVDRALGAVGLATADEVAELTSRVRELERELRVAQAGSGTAPAASVSTAQAGSPDLVTKKTVAKKVAAKKAVAKKAAPAKKAIKAGGVAGPAKKAIPAGGAAAPATKASKAGGAAAPGRAVETAPGEKRLDAKKLPPPPARKAATRRAGTEQPPA